MTALKKGSMKRVKTLTEIRNAYKVLYKKSFFSLFENLSLYKIFACDIKWQLLRILDGVQVGVTDGDKSKSAEVNVAYANLHQSPSTRSDTDGHDT